MYVGRIDRIKGVFDILEIASKLELTHPGLVRWEICGRGKDFDELSARHRELKLDGVVNLRGWTSLDDLVGVYAKSHVSIVPTRSVFREGLAMTAVEAILAGRPVVTNPVVPALEVLRSACAAAKTDDVESHLQAVLELATNAEVYDRARAACVGYQYRFYDRSYGLTAVLKKALAAFI
jgi:glycosyltransferase involved in cell wall biosynthesis